MLLNSLNWCLLSNFRMFQCKISVSEWSFYIVIDQADINFNWFGILFVFFLLFSFTFELRCSTFRSLFPCCLVEEQSRLFGCILVLDWWNLTKSQRCLFRNNDTSHSMDSKSTINHWSEELWAMERKVFSWRSTSLLGATFLQINIKRCARRNHQFTNMRQMSK